VFVGDQQAAIGVQCTNLNAQATRVELTATVRDLDGNVIATCRDERNVPPNASQSIPMLLPNAARYGYYAIRLEAKTAAGTPAPVELSGGRVRPRDNVFHPYSAFGSVRMERNPELMRRIGGGLNRNHFPVYWNNVEPQPGEWKLKPADTLEFFRSRALPFMCILGYGEPWHKGGYPRCRITSYDTFWQYIASVIDRHKGTPMVWQFWNEPNFFWHVPGPYRYEHYVMVLKGTYAIAKALDPDTPLICDGFAGSAEAMRDFARWGAAGFTDGVVIHYPGTSPARFDQMPLEGTVESKAAMIRELARIRDEHYPGQPLYNTEEGAWSIPNRTPRHGAELLARIYVTQMAAGIDRLTWFETFSAADPTYLLRGVNDGPWPAYFAYAAASRFLEDAIYVGPLSEGIAQVHLFAANTEPVIVAWAVEGEYAHKLNVGADQVTITDWQDNAETTPTEQGVATLRLGPAVQFVTGAAWKALADAVTDRLVKAAADPAIQKAMALLETRSNELIDLNALFHAARLIETTALLPGSFRPGSVAKANEALAAARKALKAREADGARLRDARTALAIAERTAYFMNLAQQAGHATYAEQLAPFAASLAWQVQRRVETEKPWYPGVMVRVALDTAAIRNNTPANQPLDEQFAPQVSKKPGDTFELEMTVYNWTRSSISGRMSPVVPDGWQARDAAFAYDVPPRKFARFLTTVSIPRNAAPQVYPVGASTEYRGSRIRELHTHRVKVE